MLRKVIGAALLSVAGVSGAVAVAVPAAAAEVQYRAPVYIGFYHSLDECNREGRTFPGQSYNCVYKVHDGRPGYELWVG
ncbi:hypothetical protein ACPZ19_39505 [Amycolatopsis lurida]